MPKQKNFEYKYPNVGRYDNLRLKWLSPVEDFMVMAKKVEEFYTPLEFYDMLVEDTKGEHEGIRKFWKYILSGLDRSQIASYSPGKGVYMRFDTNLATRVA